MPPVSSEPETPEEERDSSDLADNSRLRDDSILGGNRSKPSRQPQVPAEQLEQMYSAPSATGPGIKDNAGLPGGPSSDAAASRKKAGSENSNPLSGARPGSSSKQSGGRFSQFFASRRRRRFAFAGGGLATAAIIITLAIFGLIPYEIVHITETILNKYDRRLNHSISQRIGAHLAKRFTRTSGGPGDSNTGEPIKDASKNFDMDRFKADMNIERVNVDSSGKIVSFDLTSGERLNVNDGALNNPDSPLMKAFNNRFPPLDFFRLSIRTRAIDAIWGIRRKFLSSKDEEVKGSTDEVNKKVDEQFNTREENTDGAAESMSGNEEDAKKNLNNAKSDATAESTVAFGAAKTALTLCGMVAMSEEIHKSLWLVRVAQLVRISNSIVLPTGHQAKRGDLHTNQLAAFMKAFKNFAQAGGWKVISGVKGAKLSAKEKSRFSASPNGAVSDITGAVDNFGTICDPINAFIKALPFGIYIVPAGLDAAEIAAADEAAPLSAILQQVAISVGQNVAIGEAFSYLAEIIVQSASKPMLDAAKPSGPDTINATISGYDNYSNMNQMSNGGEHLTAAQVSQLNQATDLADAKSSQSRGLAYALFSPDNNSSLTTSLIMSIPTSSDTVSDDFSSVLASVTAPLNHSQLASIGSFITGHARTAEASGAAAEDPTGWGVAQFGIPDSLSSKYPDPEANEKWVTNYLCSQPGEGSDRPGLYDGACSGGGDSNSELTGQNDGHHDPYHDYVRECFINPRADQVADDDNCKSSNHGPNNLYDRFRIYRFDLGIANMNSSYNNDKNDQDPNASSGSSSGGANGVLNPFPGGWIPNRLDMGFDGTFKGQIIAPFSGTITWEADSFSDWGGWVQIKGDSQPSGLPTSSLYFAEGVKPLVSANEHVNAGQPIADPAPSPYGNSYGTDPGGVGEIEWGVAQDAAQEPYSKQLQNGSAAARQMVLDFAKWAESLGLGAPTQTGNAGSP